MTTVDQPTNVGGMTYEISPNRNLAPNADITYPANNVGDIYRVAAEIAAQTGVVGAITVNGTYILAGNTLLARVRVAEPWYSAVSGWVTTDSDYRTRPVN